MLIILVDEVFTANTQYTMLAIYGQSCFSGYFGAFCTQCPSCNNQGSCDDGFSGTGSCICTIPYQGTNCKQCVLGYYTEGVECVSCAAGKYTEFNGNISACLPCSAGTFNPSDSAGKCFSCG